VAFLPLYVLGFMGATRRLYTPVPAWQWLFVVAAVGACIIAVALCIQILQMVVSIRNRPSTSLRTSKKYTDMISDPWGGRTLEWSVASPAPEYNFATIPQVKGRDAFWAVKADLPAKKGKTWPSGPERVFLRQVGEDKNIIMPKNTPVGLIIALFAFCFGFGMVWHIWWLVGAGLVGVIVSVILRSFNEDIEHTIRV
ncbi:MAG: hypothetical protein Q7S26_00790, partial [bacterium]|nr:hypothetical protein [bacterium]